MRNLEGTTNNDTEPDFNKSAHWQKLTRSVEHITDAVGKPIDEGIKDTVIAMMAHELSTSQSCEGHINTQDNTHNMPFVEIYAPEPEGWQNDQEKKEQWTRKNLEQQSKTIDYLDEFYENRTTPFSTMLNIRPIGMYGGFRLQSAGSDIALLLQSTQLHDKFIAYQKEMQEFTQFLKDKYFTQQ
ncbi:hypothetical protein KJ836_00125 [Patescibacteria group bacterium]|nr:hypothetical protein [Patescibacteria group bacterium]